MAHSPIIEDPIDSNESSETIFKENYSESNIISQECIEEPENGVNSNSKIVYSSDEGVRYTNLSCEKSLIDQILTINNGQTDEKSREEDENMDDNKDTTSAGTTNQDIIIQSQNTLAEANEQNKAVAVEPLCEMIPSAKIDTDEDTESEKLEKSDIMLASRPEKFALVSISKTEKRENVLETPSERQEADVEQLDTHSSSTETDKVTHSVLAQIEQNDVNMEEISNGDDQTESMTLLPFTTIIDDTNLDTTLIPEFVGPQAGLSDSQPFLSASALSPVASFEDEKCVAIATEMASAHAPPDMPLQLAPTILINSTQPIVSIPNLNALKQSPTKNEENKARTGTSAGCLVSIKDNTDKVESKNSDNSLNNKKEVKCTDDASESSVISDVIDNIKSEENCSKADEEKVPVDFDEPEFVWEDYLEETGAQAAPPESFQHVETSIENGFEKDAVIEVGLGDGTYWLASIVTPCGQLLGLKYVDRWVDDDEEDEDEDEDGNKVESVDIWCDAFKSDVHPLGWCKENEKTLQPPAEIKDKIPNIDELLSKIYECASSPPSCLFDMKIGTAPIDFMKEGMLLEIQEELNPIHVWFVRVVQNVGGRLLLRYIPAEDENHDVWHFYMNYRIHPVGWCKEQREGGYRYEAPTFLTSKEENKDINWIEMTEKLFQEALDRHIPSHIFKDQLKVSNHLFRRGQKLEALHPKLKCAICPATVIKVINQHFFIVEIDDVTEESTDKHALRMCCHKDFPNIFPVRWCVRSGLRLLPPKGWKKTDFDWRDYLAKTNSEAAPERAFNLKIPDHDFERGMKLEAVDPDQHDQICVATIVRIVENLMWIHLNTSTKIVNNHVVDLKSDAVFPMGWCESNDYPLKPPKKTGVKKKYNTFNSIFQIEKPMTADEYRSAAYSQMIKGEGSGWCPKIYFNHRCFSGAFLSKCRIAELPKSVGPGPIVLVMKEVLSMLINGAYKSSRVLRELQLEGTPNPNMLQQVLKAKHKGKSYRATVEICKSADQLEEFCRQVCIKLECCPLLISTHCIEGDCPENCSQLTKTKYTACYVKKAKKKIGRPPGGHTNLEMGPKKRGRKRKRGRQPMNRDKRKSDDSEEVLNVDNESVCGSVGSSGKFDEELDSIMFKSNIPEESPLKKRKYQKKVLPPSDIKTRGIKLPSYSTAMYERRPRGLKIKDMLAPALDIYMQRKANKIKTSKGLVSPVSVQQVATSTSAMESIPMFKGETMLKLKSNPLYWSIEEVVDFIKDTDSAQFARILMEQEIDGQALLMLSLPTVQEYLDYKLGPAVKLCHHIERLKFAFYQQFA